MTKKKNEQLIINLVKTFEDLKSALANPTLDLPNPNNPFVQFVDQKGGSSVLNTW